MLKNILTIVLSLLLLQAAKAATSEDTLRIYLKNSGLKVSSIDSADFYRIVLPPDSNVDKDLYRVYDYYVDGKIRAVATSLTSGPIIMYDGESLNYFPNGKRKSSYRFKNGSPVGSITYYYPNGKLYYILKIENSSNWDHSNRYGYSNFMNVGYSYIGKIAELRDSTGNVLTMNGTGHIVAFDESFKKVIMEGDFKNNKKEGEWKGVMSDSIIFICTFHKNELKSGISHAKSGNHYSFTQFETEAVFSDGPAAFSEFIRNNLQYPESAKKRKIMGTVIVGFSVETNGTVSNVKIIRGVFKSLDDEALRIIRMSPLWIPAYKFGIPYTAQFNVPIDFYDH
jgi:TonB family protein